MVSRKWKYHDLDDVVTLTAVEMGRFKVRADLCPHFFMLVAHHLSNYLALTCLMLHAVTMSLITLKPSFFIFRRPLPSCIAPHHGRVHGSHKAMSRFGSHETSITQTPSMPAEIEGQLSIIHRRSLLLTSVAILIIAPAHIAHAETSKLPKAYTSLSEKIIKSLRDSLDAELEGASENEVSAFILEPLHSHQLDVKSI